MGTVIERISSAESGLHDAVKSLLTGFYLLTVLHVTSRLSISDLTSHEVCNFSTDTW